MKHTSALALVLALGVTSAHAGSFVQLATTPPGLSTSNGGLINGSQNQNSDPLYIDPVSATYVPGHDDTRDVLAGGTGDVVAQTLNYRTFAPGVPGTTTGTGTLTLLNWASQEVDLLPGEAQGIIYDMVYRDSADNKLVFGTRFVNQVDNDQEVNFLYRYGFTGYDTSAAWTRLTDSDLRLYQAGRTASNTNDAVVPFDPSAVRQKGDFSVTEGNPWSGLFLVKTNALTFEMGDQAIGFFQAGEEGQDKVGGSIAGWVPTPVPEPEAYAMLLAGLAIVGFAARRRIAAI